MSALIGQIAVSGLILGGLKKHGVINYNPSAIHDDATRTVVTQVFTLGEQGTEFLERAYVTFKEASQKQD